MKIGIILHRINPSYKGGINSYVLGLLEGFKRIDKNNKYTLLVSSQNRHLFKKFEGENFMIKEISPHRGKGVSLIIKNKLSRVIVDYLAILPGIRILFPTIYKSVFPYFISLINNLDIDILYCPHELPIYFRTPIIVSIHDIQHVYYPNFFSLGQRLHRDIFYKETVRHATIIQASSEYMKRAFINYFHLPPEKVITIRDGINNIFKRKIDTTKLINVKNKYKLPNNFIFYPAQHWPHKNHLNLIKAISYLKTQYDLKIPLVFTGEVNKRFQFLYHAINRSNIRKDIKLLGNIPFDDLPFLYKLATITAIPSLYESNSLPILEALAVGSPVAASDIEPNIELNIDNAITILNPNDYKDIAEKIHSLWRNRVLREKKIKLGRKLADGFSWERTAKNYISTFEKIYKNLSSKIC